ncbi:mitochondrial ribosomal protein subunit L20-domain-containing protein [Morchella snyderi]|nr:mitochondrial ribosomal protein subunit L20-domain-containing protein [Morchella snyderi]
MTTLAAALPRALARPNLTVSTPRIFTRGEATSRRHTKKLRLRPLPSMVIGGHGGVAPTASPAINHIIHNPPSAAPSIFATPNLFLPKEDPRRVTFLAVDDNDKDSKPKAKLQLPPPIKPPRSKTYHLGELEIAEMRALRAENPAEWTRGKLAAMYGTSKFFVGMAAETTAARKEEMQGRLATIKSRWGKIRTTARFERTRRRAGWGGADGQ